MVWRTIFGSITNVIKVNANQKSVAVVCTHVLYKQHTNCHPLCCLCLHSSILCGIYNMEHKSMTQLWQLLGAKEVVLFWSIGDTELRAIGSELFKVLDAFCFIAKEVVQVENNQTTKHKLNGKFVEFMWHIVSIPVSIHNSLLRNPDILKEIYEVVKNLQEVESEGLITPDADQSFLSVLQAKQQSEWLQQYGNTITCMDATYETLWYGFPWVVKTALGIGHVVVTIIPQYEIEGFIQEGLQRLN